MMTGILLLFILTAFRIGGFLAAFPLTAGRRLPRLVKVGVTLVLAFTWASGPRGAEALADLLAIEKLNWPLMVLLAVRETTTGLLLAIGLGLMFMPMRIAGSYLAQELGLTLASLTNADEGGTQIVFTQIFEVIGTLLFFALNLHHAVLLILNRSFARYSCGSRSLLPDASWAAGSMDAAHQVGLTIAAPVGIVLFSTILMLLVSMRLAPQFNLLTYGMPLRLMVGLIAMILFLPEMCALMVQSFLRTFSLFPI